MSSNTLSIFNFTIFKGNDIFALYIELTKEVCTYKLCGGSLVTPSQDCERNVIFSGIT